MRRSWRSFHGLLSVLKLRTDTVEVVSYLRAPAGAGIGFARKAAVARLTRAFPSMHTLESINEIESSKGNRSLCSVPSA